MLHKNAGMRTTILEALDAMDGFSLTSAAFK
jgi:hypothetical protein